MHSVEPRTSRSTAGTMITLGACASLLVLAACTRDALPAPSAPSSDQTAAATPPIAAGPGGYRIFVTNEMSGVLSVIDAATHTVIATVPLGKRPRGMRASPDRKTLFVALSGSPIGGPGVDESKLPPADKGADGIGVIDLQTLSVTRTLRGFSDPERIALSPDGNFLYTANGSSNDVTLVDARTLSVIGKIAVGQRPWDVVTVASEAVLKL